MDERIGPLDEVADILGVRMTAVMLPPCELAAQQAFVHRRQRDTAITVRHSKILVPEKPNTGCAATAAMKLPL